MPGAVAKADVSLTTEIQQSQWQMNYRPDRGAITVFVERGSFMSPETLAESDVELRPRSTPCTTDPPEALHEAMRYVFMT